jgi:hypothetical protein
MARLALTQLRNQMQKSLACLLLVFGFALSACMPQEGLIIPYSHVKPNRPNPMLMGNYCGPGTRYGTLATQPANALDEACRRHDACYIADVEHCTCDRELHDAALAIESNPAQTRSLKAKARAVRALFSTRYCEIFPRGIFRPRDKSILLTMPSSGGFE